MSKKLHIKRAYEAPTADDGDRYLVDRLWPRGIKKENLEIVDWIKDLGPSTELRKWFGHDPVRWEEFQKRYRKELSEKQELFKPILASLKKGPVTLVYSAKDEEHNQAVVLYKLILEHS